MYQGTTPAVTYTIQGYDLSDMTVYATFLNGKDLLTKTGDDVLVTYDSDTQTSTIVVALTQQETLAMKKGSVKTQLRFIDENGNAYATSKAVIQVKDVLLQTVIEYTEDDEE